MPILDITAPPKDLDKLFQAHVAELQAFNPARTVHRLVSRQRVLELSDALLISWASMIDRIPQELSKQRAEQRKLEIDRLDRRAWVFYAADLAAEEIHSNTIKKERRELAKVVAEHDRFLFKWATPLFGDDPDHAQTLRDISRGTGARDDAEDVLRLVAMYRANWKQVEHQQKAVSKARLEQAAADAARQLDYLRNSSANPARKLADAAYSLWYHDYDELMQLGRYLTRREPDSTLRFPGVRELPTRNPPQDETSDERPPIDEQQQVEDQQQDVDADPSA
ncbi:MAG TPA: hypothetical protein VK034_12860 [Enhygromyxa sp.]|nr:hypothetical protein [Enhygromyxa sp.]